jgi:3-dehydroquinate synthase
LPVTAPPGMTADRFLDLMSRDKKVVDGRLRLILLSAIGEACIVDDASDAELRALLTS